MAAPTSLPVAFLEFGRLLCDPKQAERVAAAEDDLICRLSTAKCSLARAAFKFNAGNPIESLVLRLLAVFAHQQMCATRNCSSISEVASLVAGGDPSQVLEARKTVSKLLISRQLVLRSNSSTQAELGEPLLDFLAGGKSSTPLSLTEEQLAQKWQEQEVLAGKRRPAVPVWSMLPTAKQLADGIHASVVGLDDQVRTVASRLALHIRRAELIRVGKDPGSSNECLLLIGPSGCGKTYLAETAGKVCRLPFSSVSATDMSSQAYVGLSVEDSLRPLITAANGNPEQARFGLSFLDEWDKKAAAPTNWRDVGGLCVQQEFLRLMEGCEVQIGGRRSSDYFRQVSFNTRGTCFIFAGAFVGLDQLQKKKSAPGIGFGAQPDGSRHKAALYEALESYGMIPEFLNRLTGILVFPEPTINQLAQIVATSVLPSYNRMLATFRVQIELGVGAIDLMAAAALESRTYSRGLKSIIGKLVEEIVYEPKPGIVEIEATQVRAAIEAVGLG
jgi:ATP-dependent protease Clp ATPase subunit